MWALDASDLVPILFAVAWLVVLEGLLSADNALVLAVMVRHLPKDQQKRALRYGIWGAFIFRFIAILFATTILKFWEFKVVGGLYLVYLAVRHFFSRAHAEESPGEGEVAVGRGFWATVISVEIADVAFSIDSILAAVAMAEGLPEHLHEVKLFDMHLGDWPLVFTMKDSVVLTGGILGIITMRLVAGYFLVLLDKFAGLAAGAYVLVAWIGLKLIGGGLHDGLHPKRPPGPGSWVHQVPGWVRDLPLDMPEWLFWGGMALIAAVSLLYRPSRPHVPPHGPEGITVT